MKKLGAIIVLAFAVALGYKFLYPVFISTHAEQVFPPHEEGLGEVSGPDLFTAVVLDNSPEARPQYGLSQAGVVFETVAESGITRLMAVFGRDSDVSRVGPVRSARPYFVSWAYGLGVALAHSGGSTEALAKIAALSASGGFHDINEFFAEHYFWRDAKHPAPHNLYTSIELLKKIVEKKSWSLSSRSFDYTDTAAGTGVATSTEILVDFSYPQYAAKYVYDSEKNNYLRSLGGKPDVDALNNSQIRASNVVVLYTTSTVIDKKLLTIDLVTSGSGRAVVFQGGHVQHARWQKAGDAAELKLLDADGTTIKLAPGPTWVEVIDQQGTAVWE